jgi:rhodanese-related sulfurtransferase
MPIRSIQPAVEEAKKHIENLSVEQLQAELAANPDLLVLDVREIQERVDLGTIPGSVHAPRGMLEFWADPESPYFRDYFQADRRTVLFCAGGWRSALAGESMRNLGFTDIAHLEPGFSGWQKAEAEIEDVSATSRWIRRPKQG